MAKLTDKSIQALKEGIKSDGGGLYLEVRPNGGKRFLMRWTRPNGKAAKMAIGPYKAQSGVGGGITLKQARVIVAEHQQLIADGGDPSQVETKAQAESMTFGDAAEQYLKTTIPALTNEKHRTQWRTTLMGGGRADDYCKSLRKVMIADVDTGEVLEVLKPIWASKNETASRIRGRIEKVLDFARVKGWRDGDNPARWTGNLEHVLSKRQKLKNGHHASMPHGEVSEFYKTVAIDLSAGAACFAWTILTAVRSGEARKAEWSEIDREARLWVIPPERMKMKKEHRVPLSDAAMAVLEARREYECDGLIFAGKGGKALSDMTLAGHLKRRQLPFTVHGFRSSFRDWAAEESGHSFDVIETALAHKVGSAVAQAYMRSDLLDKRRDLMERWGAYVVDCEHH